jgi:hypothetical protein
MSPPENLGDVGDFGYKFPNTLKTILFKAGRIPYYNHPTEVCGIVGPIQPPESFCVASYPKDAVSTEMGYGIRHSRPFGEGS